MIAPSPASGRTGADDERLDRIAEHRDAEATDLLEAFQGKLAVHPRELEDLPGDALGVVADAFEFYVGPREHFDIGAKSLLTRGYK